MRIKKAVAGIVAVVTVVGGSVLMAGPADAAGPRFPVMNTSEQPPDGVWFRNSGSVGDTDRVTGHGVYAGDVVEEQCYIWGEAVGTYANRLWYFVANITRPTVPNTTPPRANTGYLNAHFINDGANANEVVAGVPACGQPSPPPPPAPVGIYASPNNGGGVYDFHYAPNTKYINSQDWDTGSCQTNANSFYATAKQRAGGRPITWMASWSRSRYTPLYYLSRATPTERQALTYILMIDPGNYTDMVTCGNGDTGHPFDAGDELARWLRDNPAARLVVIAGDYTRGDGASGIQNILFNDVRNQGADRSHVGVCEYSLIHSPDSWRDSEYYIERPPLPSCPTLGSGHNNPPLGRMWHP